MKVLVIGPHPDDAEYGAGGLIAGCNQLADVSADIACFGGCPETSEGAAAPDAYQAREHEAAEAASILGSQLFTLPGCGLADGQQAVAALIRLFREHRPDLVVTVPPEDSHPFHQAIARWSLEAAYAASLVSYAGRGSGEPLPGPAQLWYMDAFSAPQAPPAFLVDVTPWFATARRALLAHRTGLRITPGLDYQMRARHSQLGCVAAVPLAEGFTPATGLGQNWLSGRTPALGLLVDLHRSAKAGQQ